MNLHYQFHCFSNIGVELCACMCNQLLFGGVGRIRWENLDWIYLQYLTSCRVGQYPRGRRGIDCLEKFFADHDDEKAPCMAERTLSIDRAAFKGENVSNAT